ncbi:MAG: hypothetical protein DRJ09_07900, partial [Bacteroidetes bacterium]
MELPLKKYLNNFITKPLTMKYLIIILAFVASSCNQLENNPSISKKEVLAVIMQQQDFWNQGNIKGYMKGYFKSDSLRFASGDHVSYGWQTTLDRYLKGYPDKKTMGTLLFSNIDIKLLSHNTALVFGQWALQR